ncbi:Predicted acyltransferases [Lelliottia amnigena]|nr:Predicted acyltransferases [Lelliottia amnigena]
MSNITISLASDKSTEKVNFRHDINLLRGLAILSVVFYHFVPKLLPGGFIGVDIFFVISGYLMTSIITKNAIKGDFSFISFYSARFRRIVPALFVVTITLMLAFWYWLPTVEYRKLGNYVGTSYYLFQTSG